MDKTEWAAYVDGILATIVGRSTSDPKIAQGIRAAGLGEWEPGIDPEAFRKQLDNLKVGDIVTFCFKRYSDWPMNFTALFSSSMSSFEYLPNQFPPYKIMCEMALTGRPGDHHAIKCRIRSVPISKLHTVDWIVKYIGICLEDFLVNDGTA